MSQNNFFVSMFKSVKSIALPIASVGVCLLILILSLNSISDTTASQQEKTLQQAIAKSAVHCYATQGIYPENIQYLIDHYGITYDENKYFVDYRIFASNIMPEITIIKK